MRQGAHRTYARPHNTEQRRSPKPVTAERDIYPPEFNVNVPKMGVRTFSWTAYEA